jgi:hypothetical protein
LLGINLLHLTIKKGSNGNQKGSNGNQKGSFLRDSLSPFSDLLFYIFFFSKTFFGNLKMDKKNVQISKMKINVQILKTMRP